jgi:hypothetical protein
MCVRECICHQPSWFSIVFSDTAIFDWILIIFTWESEILIFNIANSGILVSFSFFDQLELSLRDWQRCMQIDPEFKLVLIQFRHISFSFSTRFIVWWLIQLFFAWLIQKNLLTVTSFTILFIPCFHSF